MATSSALDLTAVKTWSVMAAAYTMIILPSNVFISTMFTVAKNVILFGYINEQSACYLCLHLNIKTYLACHHCPKTNNLVMANRHQHRHLLIGRPVVCQIANKEGDSGSFHSGVQMGQDPRPLLLLSRIESDSNGAVTCVRNRKS